MTTRMLRRAKEYFEFCHVILQIACNFGISNQKSQQRDVLMYSRSETVICELIVLFKYKAPLTDVLSILTSYIIMSSFTFERQQVLL